jgi:hypothetical protein
MFISCALRSEIVRGPSRMEARQLKERKKLWEQVEALEI